MSLINMTDATAEPLVRDVLGGEIAYAPNVENVNPEETATA